MKKSKFTEEQIAFALKQAELGSLEPCGSRNAGASTDRLLRPPTVVAALPMSLTSLMLKFSGLLLRNGYGY